MALWIDEVRKECGFKFKWTCNWHDINSIRLNSADLEEIKIFRKADGFVFVSDPCQLHSQELYDFKQPSVVFEHFCNKEWDGYTNYTPGKEDIERRHGIVYEGGINAPENLADPAQRDMFKYRTIYPYFKEAVAQGNEVIIYAGNPAGYETHLDIGATVFPPTQYDKLITEMQQYKWGWCLFGSKDDRQTARTLPNKAWEYCKAGMPIIICWADETARYFSDLGIAIVLDHPKELGNIEEQYGHLYPKLKERVDEINMSGSEDSENHIWKIESLWQKVLGK